MRLEMPLQRAHLKATVRGQPLERSQVTGDHLPKLSRGERPWHKSSPLPSGISRLAPETENLAGLSIDGHAEILRSLRGHEI